MIPGGSLSFLDISVRGFCMTILEEKKKKQYIQKAVVGIFISSEDNSQPLRKKVVYPPPHIRLMLISFDCLFILL